MEPLHLCERATPDNFDVELYLLANPDVGIAGGDDDDFPARHFRTWGVNEGRLQVDRAALAGLEAARRAKLARLDLDLPTFELPYLGTTMHLASADPQLPVPVDLSVQDYDPAVAEMVDGRRDELFLDVGAGLTQSYRHNVVYSDIAATPTTDVLCFADRLPFEDSTFDGALCRSVLEHVPDPWVAAGELTRVVRPGGTILVDWPFLQPVHGYPDHYFNATGRGAASLFERLGARVERSIPVFLHPVFTLRWVLSEWHAGLSPEDRRVFETVTVSDLLNQTPMTVYENNPWANGLPVEVQRNIAAGTRLIITNGG